MQSSIHASLKWQDGGTPVSKWIGLCIFSLYMEFTALQRMPVLLLTHVSTSTLLCACLWYEYHYSFCVFGVASKKKNSLAQTTLTIPVAYIWGRMLGSYLTQWPPNQILPVHWDTTGHTTRCISKVFSWFLYSVCFRYIFWVKYIQRSVEKRV